MVFTLAGLEANGQSTILKVVEDQIRDLKLVKYRNHPPNASCRLKTYQVLLHSKSCLANQIDDLSMVQ